MNEERIKNCRHLGQNKDIAWPTPRLARPQQSLCSLAPALSSDGLTKAARQPAIIHHFPIQHLIHPQETIGRHLLFPKDFNSLIGDIRHTLIEYVTPRHSKQINAPEKHWDSLEHIQRSIQRTQPTVARL